MNCRSIPGQTWEHVRRSLIFYFSRRHCQNDAEDLAQETLYAVWNRSDFEFEKEDDFPRVCYAFAGRILKARLRNAGRQTVELDPATAESYETIAGMNASELAVYLEEIQRMGQSRLNDRDWQLIKNSMESNGASGSENNAGNLRVYLHRARKKLARISGWRREEM